MVPSNHKILHIPCIHMACLFYGFFMIFRINSAFLLKMFPTNSNFWQFYFVDWINFCWLHIHSDAVKFQIFLLFQWPYKGIWYCKFMVPYFFDDHIRKLATVKFQFQVQWMKSYQSSRIELFGEMLEKNLRMTKSSV